MENGLSMASPRASYEKKYDGQHGGADQHSPHELASRSKGIGCIHCIHHPWLTPSPPVTTQTSARKFHGGDPPSSAEQHVGGERAAHLRIRVVRRAPARRDQPRQRLRL